MQLKKSLIALALTSTLAACGSSSDEAEIKTSPEKEVPVVTETTINGKAIKGVLTNAVVTVYKFVDGNPVALTDTELKDANVSTDGEGNYTFTVLDYTGPIKVELSPSTDPANPTKMTCDAPAGCGDVAFAQEINLTSADPSFKLAAISVVNPDEEVKINVSALTHLASKLIEADEDGINTTTVAAQSSKIANTFGITGDITLLEPTVTDSAAAVAAEDNNDELKYGLINAGIMAALFSGETDDAGILSGKLAEVAADLVENDGAFLVAQDEDDGFELALAEVLEGAAESAKTAAEQIATDDTLTTTLNLAQLETQLINEQVYQESNVGDDGRAAVVVDVLTEGDAVAKAKAMVEDVRLFSHLFNDTTKEGEGIKKQGDEYVALLEAAGTMVEAEADSFGLLAKLSDALSNISTAYDDGTITKAAAAAGISIAAYIDGATGIVTFEEETAAGGILFNVDATSGSEKAQLNVSAEFSEDKKSITLTINGLVESAGAKFTLNEGSFAKINFDTAASRAALDDDTFEGEIVSGELELALSLAQKATDAVPNPVTFEGMIKTKLLLVEERILNENWEWDDQQQQSTLNYGRPELEGLVLPETLTLSGAFNSLEGDEISATLTVNIDDLATYEAPEFKYIGKEVSDVINFTFSEDLNNIVLTEADKTVDSEQIVETRTFTPGNKVGEWTATNSTVTTSPEEHYWGTGIERKIISKRIPSPSGTAEEATRYTRAYITGEEEISYGAKSIRITPVDNDANGSIDAYNIHRLRISNNIKGTSYGASFDSMMDANGNLLNTDGSQLSWDNAEYLGNYTSIEEFMKYNSYQLIANPLTVDNGAELLAQTITSWWGNSYSLNVEDVGTVTVFFNDEELADIAAGKFTELNPTAYLVEPLIKDAFTITVSADSNTVTVTDESNTRTYSVDYTSPGNFVFDREVRNIDGSTISDKRTYSTHDVGLDVAEVTILRTNNSGYGVYHRFFRITPIDTNGDNIADYLNRSITSGEYINAEGILTDANGVALAEAESYYFADSYAEQNFDYYSPFNPMTVTNALEAYKSWLSNVRASSLYTNIDEIGSVENTLSAEEVAGLTTGSTTVFDGYNTAADSNNSLEDEETFLDINAALTLEAILGDYQVKIQLSGERSALEEGTFDLDMSYRLPEADTQRSFTAHYNTEIEGRLTANNADGVVLVLNEADEDATGTQVLGQILVGPTAIVAATIEDRDGAIFIVYADIDNDGIQEEESL
ncbi:hypothetical protein [Colwellia psychrerythraea]|uniref:Lipoprotein n=1 Tax=Colwellia psychrerythraea TaxID=28229 RepID=A0A099KDW8_COLPS|nr:hypothetical protein [Colwellia psychrerythraea]KGJ88954.1 hypothetical protein ND2E_0247 [Colwellia psychrerythraea]